LHGNSLIHDRQLCVECREDFTPGVWLRDLQRRLNAQFAQYSQRLGAAHNGLNVRERIEKSLLIDMPFDARDQLSNADPREKNNRVDLSGD